MIAGGGAVGKKEAPLRTPGIGCQILRPALDCVMVARVKLDVGREDGCTEDFPQIVVCCGTALVTRRRECQGACRLISP